MLVGCSGNDSSSLLKSVPKDTGFLVVANIEKMHEKIGSDVSLADSDLSNLGPSSGSMGKLLKVVFDPKAGVDYNVPLIVFERKYSPVVTFMLSDKNAFEKTLAAKAGIKLMNEGGIKKSADNTVFISDKQVWLSPGYPELSKDDILLFKALGEKESVLSLQCAEKFLDSRANLSLLYSLSFLNGEEMLNPSYIMGLNFLFESPKYVEAHINFEKGAVKGTLNILDSKGSIANCTIKPVKINMKSLKDFNGRGNMFFAMGADPAIMALVSMGLQNVPMVPRDAVDAIKNLNGNIILAVDINGEEPGASVSLDFDNVEAAEKGRSLVASFLPEDKIGMSIAGNTLSAVYNDSQNGQPISDVASKFEGADIGIVVVNHGNNAFRRFLPETVREFSLIGKSKGNALEFGLTLDTDPAQNSLLTILKSL